MIINIFKRIIMAAFLIYAFNMICVNFGIIIPINIWTLGYASVFDVSGVIVMLILKTIGV